MRIDGHSQTPENSALALNRAKIESLRWAHSNPQTNSESVGSASEHADLLDAVSEPRHERLEELRQQIVAGTYKIDAARVADAMLASLVLR